MSWEEIYELLKKDEGERFTLYQLLQIFINESDWVGQPQQLLKLKEIQTNLTGIRPGNCSGCNIEVLRNLARWLNNYEKDHPQVEEVKKIDVGTGEIAYKKQLPGKWTPGQGTKGTADISATIRGRSVKIEVKQKDKQSEVQKQYQQSIESAGGIYEIFRDFDSFVLWYEKFILSL